jgi:hypothetical protein
VSPGVLQSAFVVQAAKADVGVVRMIPNSVATTAVNVTRLIMTSFLLSRRGRV